MTSVAGLRVGFVGSYRADYNRTRLLQAALERAGATVVERRTSAPGLLARNRELIRRGRGMEIDVLVAPYPGYSTMLGSFAVSRRLGVPLVFDAFLSLYETRVLDRREVAPWSPRGLAYRALEIVACALADVVLIDTALHADYLARRTGRRRGDFRVLPVVVDEREVGARPPDLGDAVVVLYYGNYIPLHGMPTITAAIDQLATEHRNLRFVLVGDGPGRPAAEKRLRAHSIVSFVDPVPYGRLVELVSAADICLGVFAMSDKTRRVVPNKVVDALAAARPVITADTPAIRMALDDDEGVVLVPAGDVAALVDALRSLAGDPSRRLVVGERGRAAFERHFSVEALTEKLDWLADVVSAGPSRLRRWPASARGRSSPAQRSRRRPRSG